MSFTVNKLSSILPIGEQDIVGNIINQEIYDAIFILITEVPQCCCAMNNSTMCRFVCFSTSVFHP